MDNITVTLPVQAWNSILGVLGERPFKEVADLIMEIKRQADGQVAVTNLPVFDEPEIETAV